MKIAAIAAHALALLAIVLSLPALAQPCPPGQHPDKQAPTRICLWDDFVPHVAKLTSPNQVAEKAAWIKYNDLVDKYDAKLATYKREQKEADEIDKKLDSANCLQFKCPTQDLKRRQSAHEQAADRAKDAANDLVAPCEAAEAQVVAARARVDAAKEERVSKRNPSCPGKVGVSSTKCPKGMHYRMGKCVK